MTADFRREYGISVFDVGSTVSYEEAIILAQMLRGVTTSWTGADMNGYKHPFDSTAPILYDMIDVLRNQNQKRRQKPYPRPWKSRGKLASQYSQKKTKSVSMGTYDALRRSSKRRVVSYKEVFASERET